MLNNNKIKIIRTIKSNKINHMTNLNHMKIIIIMITIIMFKVENGIWSKIYENRVYLSIIILYDIYMLIFGILFFINFKNNDYSKI